MCTWSRGGVPGPGGVYLFPGVVPGPRGMRGAPGPGGCTWNLIRLGAPAHGITTKTVHKTLSGCWGRRGSRGGRGSGGEGAYRVGF